MKWCHAAFMTTKRQGHIQKRAPWRLYDDEKAVTHAKTGAMGLS
ncbi:hypothetical protein KIS4809_3429 [Bacillus sp. ZZV12-4809]|nr:hypothetical protein KIS4809_3429 [Bacillus sp. ZZV12-4809]